MFCIQGRHSYGDVSTGYEGFSILELVLIRSDMSVKTMFSRRFIMLESCSLITYL